MGTHPREPISPLVVDYRDDSAHDLINRPVLSPGDTREGLRILAPGGIDFIDPTEPGAPMQISYRNIRPTLPRDEQLFVWIRIQYHGPLRGDGGYATNACWRYDRITNRFVLWGNDQHYNGMI